MRDPRAICLLCRARQSFQAAARRGAFSSLDNNVNVDNVVSSWSQPRARWHTTAASTSPVESSTDSNAAGSALPARPPAAAHAPGKPRKKGPAFLLTTARGAQRRPRRNQPLPADDAALAVFRDIVEGQRPAQSQGRGRGDTKRPVEAKIETENENELEGEVVLGQDAIRELQRQHQEHHDQPSAGRDAGASMELYNQLIKLTQMRSQPDATPAALFRFFETSMYPHMTGTASRRLPNIFRQATQQLVREVSAAKQRDYRTPDLPRVARITQIRRQLDLLNVPGSWTPLVLGLLAAITERGEPANELVDDLVQTWRMFSLPDVVVADEEALRTADAGEFRMPVPDAAKLEKFARRQNLQRGLACLFPRYAPPQTRPLSPALLATYAVLMDPVITPSAARDQARAFLDALAKILATTHVSRQAAADIFQSQPALGAYVLSRWPLVGVGEAAQASNADGTTTPPHSSSEARRATLDGIHKQLMQALRARNLQACEAAWERFWAAVSLPDVEGAKLMRGSAEVFDSFIMAFTMMRMPDRAIGVWNLMTMAGIQPTLRTWTSFMVGYKHISNPAGIHSIWAKLVASGVQVDTAAWTARVSGLIESGDAAAGMQALDEMQQQWAAWQAQAAKAQAVATEGKPDSETPPKVPKAVKPTIEPVNAAIAGLLRKKNLPAAKQVLAWAGRHGIEPDIITFNTILRPTVRDGRGDEVGDLLSMMRARGIQPDEATVTILLDAALGNGVMAGRSADQQVEAVKTLLAEVEAYGLEANLHMYAKIVYLLLESDRAAAAAASSSADPSQAGSAANAAIAAVSVVLKRMRQRGLAVSAHIYTILAEHYFESRPPDFNAVHRLIENGDPGIDADASAAKEEPLPPVVLDRVFWERVVRGFAQAGDTASAQRYFVNIADSISVTSSTLEDLLRALIRNGEWDAAADLVAKVQAQKTMRVQGVAGEVVPRLEDDRQFRHRFWHLAAEHNLLRLQ